MVPTIDPHHKAVPTLETIDASEPLEKIIEALCRDGGVIVANLLSPELVEETRVAIEPFITGRATYSSTATDNEAGKAFFPPGTTRLYGLVDRIPDQLAKIVRTPAWKGIMDHFLTGEYTSWKGDELFTSKYGYTFNTTAVLRLAPGVKAQPLHQDDAKFQANEDPIKPVMVGCLIAGTDCTKKNGATAVIPGSHLWGRNRQPFPEECTQAVMKAGSALFTLGATFHGASANNADPSDHDAYRTLYAVFAQRDNFRPNLNHTLSTPIDVARRLPEDLLRLAGYYKALGGLNFVEDHQHSIEFMQDPENKLGIFNGSA
ncbi:hypothetical protein MNV49_001934 [Pseudohyphozyma bogoriensis]|nr:hypothetical protein MNV49_001934 [Pseudohyphozyma bogoriensis]